jgi:hypothetical protein
MPHKYAMTERRYSFQTLSIVAITAVGCTILVTMFLPTGLTSHFQYRRPETKVGDTLIIEDISLRVLQVERIPGQAPVTAPAGFEYLVATVFIGNGTSHDIQIAPLLNFHLKDTAGRVFEITANPNATAQLSGPLVSGDSLQEEISFLVPTDARGLVLLYEPGQSGQQVARILLEP